MHRSAPPQTNPQPSGQSQPHARFMNVGDGGGDYPYRSWADCRRYGFMAGGNKPGCIQRIRHIQVGDLLLAYANGHGYVGVGRVTQAAVPQHRFITQREHRRLIDLPLTTPPDPTTLGDPRRGDWCVYVRWLHTVDRTDAIMKHHAHRGTACAVRRPRVIDDILRAWALDPPQRRA